MMIIQKKLISSAMLGEFSEIQLTHHSRLRSLCVVMKFPRLILFLLFFYHAYNSGKYQYLGTSLKRVGKIALKTTYY